MRTANGRDFCHQVHFYHYFVSQYSEFCRHNPLKWTATSNTKDKRIFRYRLSPEIYGYNLVVYLLKYRSLQLTPTCRRVIDGVYHLGCRFESRWGHGCLLSFWTLSSSLQWPNRKCLVIYRVK